MTGRLHLEVDRVVCDCERGPCGGVIVYTVGDVLLCPIHRVHHRGERHVAHAADTCGLDTSQAAVLALHVNRSHSGNADCTCGWREWVPMATADRQDVMHRLWREHVITVLGLTTPINY